MQGPQLVVIVPQRELGVQICLLIYKLFGGSLSSRLPGDQANMFTYTGPRGLKVWTLAGTNLCWALELPGASMGARLSLLNSGCVRSLPTSQAANSSASASSVRCSWASEGQ